RLAQRGLAVQHIGLKGLVLPHQKIITANQNFFDLREVQHEMVDGLPIGAIGYQDGPSRLWIIESATSREINSGYDLPEVNQKGHLFDPGKDLELVDIEAAVKPSSFKLPEKLDSRSAGLLYFALTYPERSVDSIEALRETIQNADQGQAANYQIRREAASRIADKNGLDLEELSKLEQSLKAGNFDYSKFNESLKKAFSKIGVKLKNQDFEHHAYLFHEAYLLSALKADVKDFDEKRIAQSLIALLERWPEPKSAMLFFQAHPEFLANNSDLKRYARSLVKADRYSIRQLRWMAIDLRIEFLTQQIDLDQVQALIETHESDRQLVELLRDLEDQLTQMGGAEALQCRLEGK
ncbi:MAG: hypothetical protein AAF202_08180, partial [Pseudomonadota bacterium]